MFNVVRFIVLPLLIGLLVGVVAAIIAVSLSRVLMLKLSSMQETIGFIGFVVWFGLIGLIDSANRFVAWLRMHNSNESLDQTSETEK
ncbi:hypothetical protein AGMMS49960_21100 [Betaproteobacteria bacterium]|nr:hypothetical protein AGMMS49960_21100 [Betaproteobacteria bacterium]